MELIDEDLEQIVDSTLDIWESLRRQCIFITGGTGFFGIWLVNSFLKANRRLKLEAKVILLTRDKNALLDRFPELIYASEITLWEGDVVNFDFPEIGIDYIIHAAVDADDRIIYGKPLLTFDTIVNGTRRVLDLSVQKNVKSILIISSGAVYGPQPSHISHINENYNSAPNVLLSSSYAEGKRIAEFLGSVYNSKHGIPVKIARCFAFVGPYLPLNKHYAIGNFIDNVIKGQDITITSDGTPRRSYMYPTDLVIWLWKILIKGKSTYPYNVGSEEDFSLLEIATAVAELSDKDISVNVIKKSDANVSINRYVPSTERIRNDLGLVAYFGLKNSIRKTLAFYEKLDRRALT
ncbi:NAD-dependent epimerase/dehydratase family protein [Spirosoma aerolatum]|uniref:NAD-dependent epimerase/dehydratase family protein n=1 Tax=Spirosoma aerolatum TaxID=1211326 RepID=UPI0009AEB0B7|nr:NAD-dependent epimerase/dehydratase family protein [Spirosoma aerolatum]